MSNMCINVEFLAGTSILEAVTEAKEKAINLNIAYIKFKFNCASFSIGPHANIKKAVKQLPISKYICEF